MHDALLVGGLQGLGDLPRDRQGVLERNGRDGDPVGESWPLDQLHHQHLDALDVLEPVDGRDVRMIQRGEHFRFALEPRQALRIVREGIGQEFDRDRAIELCVARAVDLSHSAFAQLGHDLIASKGLAYHRGLCWAPARISYEPSREPGLTDIRGRMGL